MDRTLWTVARYADFLEARKALLAQAANALLTSLSHETGPQTAPLSEPEITAAPPAVEVVPSAIPGGVDDEAEEKLILQCRAWVAAQGLPEGEYEYELVSSETGEPVAILDLAWPDGLQQGLSEPVALLIDEGRQTFEAVNRAGYRYFTSVASFKGYVEREILALEA